MILDMVAERADLARAGDQEDAAQCHHKATFAEFVMSQGKCHRQPVAGSRALPTPPNRVYVSCPTAIGFKNAPRPVIPQIAVAHRLDVHGHQCLPVATYAGFATRQGAFRVLSMCCRVLLADLLSLLADTGFKNAPALDPREAVGETHPGQRGATPHVHSTLRGRHRRHPHLLPTEALCSGPRQLDADCSRRHCG